MGQKIKTLNHRRSKVFIPVFYVVFNHLFLFFFKKKKKKNFYYDTLPPRAFFETFGQKKLRAVHLT
jgi:hypothetical protein